ncbi:MAG: site-specific tyrosine recombinase XerC [Nitrospirota bacterium]
MALRQKRRRRGEPPDKKRPVEHSGLFPYLTLYLEWRTLRFVVGGQRSVDSRLRRFIAWCDERGLQSPTEITRPIIERYQRHLFYARKPDGQPLSVSSQIDYLRALRGWFRFLVRENHVVANPAADLVLPRRTRRLPKHVLSVAEVGEILRQPDLSMPGGVRDRAILELFYATGLRRSELAHLKRDHLDRLGGTLFVESGKGGKDRYVPVGGRALSWLEKYEQEVRHLLVVPPDDGTVFLTDYGEPFTKNRLGDLVKGYVMKTGIAHGACHLFRHAIATHMLENGADLRFIQAMLGHSEMTTTAIYTHVAMRKLREVYDAAHPAQRGRETDATLPAESRQQLFAALDADDDESDDLDD